MSDYILLTGCAGFIGVNFLNLINSKPDWKNKYNYVILDALTYAANKKALNEQLDLNQNFTFIKGDLRDSSLVQKLFKKYQFKGVLNFAAESHVDRSISNPNIFVESNVLGTLNLLNEALKIKNSGKIIRYLQVSTDEVYGELSLEDKAFSEETPIKPNSPYSASKASADLLVNAFHHTYGLDTIITRCSNNYGPYQNDEKFIPTMIRNAISNKPLPVYGTGSNIRDWIFVDDHNRGIWEAFHKGKSGQAYNFGGASEMKNLDVAKNILNLLGKSESLINYVSDRLGHDFRYAINFEKASKELNWFPEVNFKKGLSLTLDWYKNHYSNVKAM